MAIIEALELFRIADARLDGYVLRAVRLVRIVGTVGHTVAYFLLFDAGAVIAREQIAVAAGNAAEGQGGSEKIV